MIFLDKWRIKVYELLKKHIDAKGPGRQVHGRIRVTSELAEATNGHWLIKVRTKLEEEVPAAFGEAIPEAVDKLTERIVLDADVVERLTSLMKGKKKDSSPLAMLMARPGKPENDQDLNFLVHNGDGRRDDRLQRTVAIGEKSEEEFPKTDDIERWTLTECLGATAGEIKTAAFNPAYVRDIADLFVKSGVTTMQIVLNKTGRSAALLFGDVPGGEASIDVVLMPMEPSEGGLDTRMKRLNDFINKEKAKLETKAKKEEAKNVAENKA